MGHDVDLRRGTDPDDGHLDDEELAPIDPTRLVVTGSPLNLDVPPWMAEAACRGMDEKVFFPTRGESVARREGGLPRLCGAGGLPRVRPRQRRGARHLGRHERARAARAAPRKERTMRTTTRVSVESRTDLDCGGTVLLSIDVGELETTTGPERELLRGVLALAGSSLDMIPAAAIEAGSPEPDAEASPSAAEVDDLAAHLTNAHAVAKAEAKRLVAGMAA